MAARGSIYHHFGSKEGVLAALLVGIVESSQAALLEHRDQLAARNEVRGLNRRFLTLNPAWLDRQAQTGRLPELTLQLAHAIVFAPVLEVCRLWLTERGFPQPLTLSDPLGRAARGGGSPGGRGGVWRASSAARCLGAFC